MIRDFRSLRCAVVLVLLGLQVACAQSVRVKVVVA